MMNACERVYDTGNSILYKRIRIYVPVIYKDKKVASALENFVKDIFGILYIRANPVTGNLLVQYDEALTDEAAIKRQIYRGVSRRNFKNTGMVSNEAARLKVVPAIQPGHSMNEVSCDNIHISAGDRNVTGYHSLLVHDVENRLNTDRKKGLTKEQAELKLHELGYNVISETKRKSILKRFFENLNEFSTKMLVGAGLLSTFLGQLVEGIAVLGIAAAGTVLSTIQQHRADQSLYSLNKMMVTKAHVIRNGKQYRMDAKYLVPGDMILVEAGERVPADARLIDGCDLKTSEAMLTGESMPVCKSEKICDMKTELAERSNMLYMGTSVLTGRGRAIVTATGRQTEIGKIADILHNIKNECAPIQNKMKSLTTRITKLSLIACLGLSALRLFRGASPVSVIVLGISFAIGAIPESLPALVTAAMARSVQKMARNNAIVRKLPAVETLGSANVICCDKTGTLTMNEMTVKEIFVEGNAYELTGSGYHPQGEIKLRSGNHKKYQGLQRILTTGILCNNSRIKSCEGRWSVHGDPTEGALITAAYKYDAEYKRLAARYRRIQEIPFDSSTGYMTVVASCQEGKYAYCKGSLSKVIDKCTSIYDDGNERLFTSTDRENIYAVAEQMGSRALRILAFGYKKITKEPGNIDSNFVFLGLMGMEDPPREDAEGCIKKCHKAGIKVVMITGDNKYTAAAIGKKIGLLTDGIILSGPELEAMTEEELSGVINRVQIFARTSPEQKYKIVKAFKRAGNVVAMTGDGINDAPAMKEADIGIAMGASGSDVARDTADIILTDDNICTITAAIEEGRNVNRNIKNSLRYLLSGCLGEMIAIGAATLLTGISPLISMQILWTNVIAETILGSSLTLETPPENIMDCPPVLKNDDILDGSLKKQVIRRGIVTGLTTFGIFQGSLLAGASLTKARTLAFTGIILSQIINLYSCRANKGSRNRYMNIASIACLLLLGGIIYLPFISTYFLTGPLLFQDILLLAGTSVLAAI